METSSQNIILCFLKRSAIIPPISIRALHYYERKNILKPAYTDPDSEYRYYSYNQSHFIALIMNCVDFGIPLKEIASVVEADDMTALKSFAEQSIETLEKKQNY